MKELATIAAISQDTPLRRPSKMFNEIDASLELLERLGLSGDLDAMDAELKKDVVESFQNTGYLKTVYFNKRPVIVYHDEKRSMYLYGDSYRELTSDELIAFKNEFE